MSQNVKNSISHAGLECHWAKQHRLGFIAPYPEQVGHMACFTSGNEVISCANAIAYPHPANSAVGHYPGNYEVGEASCDLLELLTTFADLNPYGPQGYSSRGTEVQ